jgi:molecular chaperone DnaK (HSP70)
VPGAASAGPSLTKEDIVAEPILVADFGTCFSSAAVISGDGVQLVMEPTTGSYAWPSSVYADGDRLLIGTPAENRKNRDPTRYRSELKRYLGQDEGIVLGQRSYQPAELVAAVLAALKAEAQKLTADPIRRAVLTVPASYGLADQRRALMISAAEATGLGTVELLAEPVAAVFAPMIGPQLTAGDLMLIYDFGGGTFDTALVQIGGGTAHEVRGSAALDDCGGLDLDALLISRLTAGAEGWLPAFGTGAADTSLRVKVTLGDVARHLKHQLSDTLEAEEFVLPDAPSARLSRAELDALVAPLLGRTVECCRDLLGRLDVKADDVSGAVIVGGSTRMPAVSDTLTAAFGFPLRRADDPDLAVVGGAPPGASTPSAGSPRCRASRERCCCAGGSRTRDCCAGWSNRAPLTRRVRRWSGSVSTTARCGTCVPPGPGSSLRCSRDLASR